MSSNTFGHLFRYTTWGESHGEAIGCVIDGVPPNMSLTVDDIQPFLDRRRPGQNKFTTQRDESDQVKILSGVFDGVTTGTPISLMIENTDARSRDYSDIKDKYRPGHADYTYDAKYGLRDYRGGGRSSARETAMRVAAGAVALKILKTKVSADIHIRGYVASIGEHDINPENFDWDEVGSNPFFTPDRDIVPVWEKYLGDIRKNGDSIGAVVEVIAENIPVGWGAPVSNKLDADLAGAMMGVNAVKGVEIGAGFASTKMMGSVYVDEMRNDNGVPVFLSNQSGGILGGISTGADIVTRIAFKPTSSILTPVKTITRDGTECDIVTKGRHDPCVGIRGVPVCEAMMAIVLCDHYLRHKAQCG